MKPNYKIADIAVAHLEPAPFNNKWNKSQLAHLSEYWDWDDCRPLEVGPRKANGKHDIWTGKHRHATILERFGPAQKVRCHVYESESEEFASRRFLGEAKRRPMGPAELFQLRVTAGDEEAVAVQRICRGRGFQVSPHYSRNNIQADGAVLDVIRNGGETALDRTLAVIVGAWDDEKGRLMADIVKGIGLVYCSDRYAESVVEGRMIQALAAYRLGPLKMLNRAHHHKEQRGCELRQGVAFEVVDAYNRQDSKGRLPKWEFPV